MLERVLFFRYPIAALLAFLGLACSTEPHGQAAEQESDTSEAAAPAPRPKPSAKQQRPRGPRLAVEAGAGVGPIRLGANVATIERLMEAPCEIKTDQLCRYVERGVDFHLVGGETAWIHVQRKGRPAGRDFRGDPVEFGFFNGMIPPDLRMGMLPSAIQQYLGPPERVEYVPQPNPTTVIERHYYPGLVAEYDLYSNGKLILGGIRIVKK